MSLFKNYNYKRTSACEFYFLIQVEKHDFTKLPNKFGWSDGVKWIINESCFSKSLFIVNGPCLHTDPLCTYINLHVKPQVTVHKVVIMLEVQW